MLFATRKHSLFWNCHAVQMSILACVFLMEEQNVRDGQTERQIDASVVAKTGHLHSMLLCWLCNKFNVQALQILLNEWVEWSYTPPWFRDPPSWPMLVRDLVSKKFETSKTCQNWWMDVFIFSIFDRNVSYTNKVRRRRGKFGLKGQMSSILNLVTLTTVNSDGRTAIRTVVKISQS